MNEKLPPSTGPLSLDDLPPATSVFEALTDEEWQMSADEREFWRERGVAPVSYRSARDL